MTQAACAADMGVSVKRVEALAASCRVKSGRNSPGDAYRACQAAGALGHVYAADYGPSRHYAVHAPSGADGGVRAVEDILEGPCAKDSYTAGPRQEPFWNKGDGNMLTTPGMVSALNRLIGPLGLSAAAVDPRYFEPGQDGFMLTGLDAGPVIFKMPAWTVTPWRRGFGGWLATSGRSTRFVRQRLSHVKLGDVVADLVLLSQQKGPDGVRIDVRTPAVRERIKARLSPKGFYVQDFDVQLAEAIAESLAAVVVGKTSESRAKAVSRVKAAVTKHMTSFPVCRGVMTPGAEEKIRGHQYKLVLGYPRTGIPMGTDAFFRDWFAEHLASRTGEVRKAEAGGGITEGTGLVNCWGEGPFTVSLSCTSKGEPGTWVTVVPPVAMRDTPSGRESVALSVPLMMAAQVAIGYNPKRTFREGNGWFNSEPLAEPRPLDNCLKNGFEHYAGPDLDRRRTQLVCCFASIEGINRYRDSVTGEALNLDDIIVTEEGSRACRAELRRRESMTSGEWQEKAPEFCGPDGRMLPGFDLDPNLVRSASIKGHDVFDVNPTVWHPSAPDEDWVFKILIEGSHKAMVKKVTTVLMGVDAAGRRFPIDVVVSGDSIKDKKLPHVPLSAVAGRAGVHHWDDFQGAIHPDRGPFEPDPGSGRRADRQYLTWARKYDDLVKAVAEKLHATGEDPTGEIDVYAWEPSLADGDDLDPFLLSPSQTSRWAPLGRACVGYVRASRLWENERSSSKTRSQGAVPFQPFLRFLANDDTPPSESDLRDLSTVIDSYRRMPRVSLDRDEDGYASEAEAEDGLILI